MWSEGEDRAHASDMLLFTCTTKTDSTRFSHRAPHHQLHIVRWALRTRRYLPKLSQEFFVQIHVPIPHVVQSLQRNLVKNGIDRDAVREGDFLLHSACVIDTAVIVRIEMAIRKVLQRDGPTGLFQCFVHQYQRLFKFFEHHDQIIPCQRIVHFIQISHIPCLRVDVKTRRDPLFVGRHLNPSQMILPILTSKPPQCCLPRSIQICTRCLCCRLTHQCDQNRGFWCNKVQERRRIYHVLRKQR